jgi:hypothetical protein
MPGSLRSDLRGKDQQQRVPEADFGMANTQFDLLLPRRPENLLELKFVYGNDLPRSAVSPADVRYGLQMVSEPAHA